MVTSLSAFNADMKLTGNKIVQRMQKGVVKA